MLPPGLTAQPADRPDHHRLRALHPSAQTVVRLVVGACSCDLVRARHAGARVDERDLRRRYRQAGAPRDSLLAVIERHRRGAAIPPPTGGWPRALAAFVAEHARNAGETLYLLRFSAPSSEPDRLRAPRRVAAAEVLARPDDWLSEQVPVVVGR